MNHFCRKLLITICVYGFVHELSAKTVFIKNESDWNLSINSQDLGFHLILRPQQAHRIATEQSLSIKPYGDVKGRVGNIFLEEKIIQPAATNAFDVPLLLIKTDDTPLSEKQPEEQSWLKWTLEKAANVATTLTEAAQKITGTQPYTIQIMPASTYDIPTLHELLSQATEPRYFLKLDKDFKPEEVAAASRSLIENNINILSDGVLKKTLTTLANTARDLLENKRRRAPTTWQDALARARKNLGKEVACALVRNTPLSTIDPLLDSHNQTQKNSAYKELIIDLMWHLYAIAENKHQAFTEGTFVLVGPAADTVQTFLMNYVNMVNPLEHSPLSPSSPTAYARISSHFDHSFTHYGIDVGSVLPEGKRHILFGSVEPVLEDNFTADQLQELGGTIKAGGRIKDNNDPDFISRFFIKLENYGLGFKDITGHGLEYILSLKTKVVARYSGASADDDPQYRKERVPQDFKNRIEIIAPNNGPFKKECSELGFQCLFSQVRTPKYVFDKKTEQELSDYLKELQQEKKNGLPVYDRLGLRFGREVILLQKELCPPSAPRSPLSPQRPVAQSSVQLDTETTSAVMQSGYFQSMLQRAVEQQRLEEEGLKKGLEEAKKSSPLEKE